MSHAFIRGLIGWQLSRHRLGCDDKTSQPELHEIQPSSQHLFVSLLKQMRLNLLDLYAAVICLVCSLHRRLIQAAFVWKQQVLLFSGRLVIGVERFTHKRESCDAERLLPASFLKLWFICWTSCTKRLMCNSKSKRTCMELEMFRLAMKSLVQIWMKGCVHIIERMIQWTNPYHSELGCSQWLDFIQQLISNAATRLTYLLILDWKRKLSAASTTCNVILNDLKNVVNSGLCFNMSF